MKKFIPIAAAVLSLTAGPSFTFGANPGASGALDQGQTLMMPRGGPIVTTGQVGQMQTTTLPGSAGQGLLTNNGNGTSTLIVPGGMPETLATPR
jgi:hypothetical protein